MELNSYLKTAGDDFTHATEEHAPVFVAVDLGSTETRTEQFDGDGSTSGVLHLDSNYAEVNHSIEHIANPSNALDSKLEAIIEDISESNKSDPAFKSIHVVKGALMNIINVHTVNTTANASKIDQIPTYVNVIFNIGLTILLRAASLNSVPSNVIPVDATISLPPEDTTSQSRIDFFKSRVAGEYRVSFPRLNVQIRFKIAAHDVMVLSEPNAVAICQQVKDPIPTDTVVGFIDMGGRSSGYSFVRNGVLLEDGCMTEPIGGNTLKTIIAQRVSEKFNIQKPTIFMIDNALPTGQMRVGNKLMDISDCISAAKREISAVLFNGFMTAMDANNLQTQQLSQVYCSGRTFGSSMEGTTVKSASLMNNLEDMYHARSPYTGFDLMSSEDPVVTGLIFARFAKV
ncbi:MAG: hypothetical protein RSC43_00075 [Clostridia bacterium]